MLLGGVTTFCDMYYFEDEVAKAAKELNIRGILCETVIDFPSPDSKKKFGGLEYSKWFIEKWKDDELIIPGIAPHAPYTNNDKSLKEAYNISKKYNVPITMHVAEMGYELKEYKDKYNLTSVGYLDKLGILDSNFISAHTILVNDITMHVAEMGYELKEYKDKYNLTSVGYLDKLGILDSNFISAHTILVNDEDIQILKIRDVKVSHNIGANSKGAKGIMPIFKMKENNIDIGLGTDGPMSGNTLDIITQMSQVGKIHKLFNNDRTLLPSKMKENNIDIGLGTDGPMSGNTLDIITQMSQVGKIHKLFNNDRTLLPSVELVEMATIGGARVLGIDNKVGSIEVGKNADLVLIETQSVNMQPIYDYYSTIVYSSNPSNVDGIDNKVGSIEVGKNADLVLIETQSVNMQPIYDYYSTIVYSSNPSNVDTVIVNGDIVVKNKKLVSGDFNNIRKDLLKLKNEIIEVANTL